MGVLPPARQNSHANIRIILVVSLFLLTTLVHEKSASAAAKAQCNSNLTPTLASKLVGLARKAVRAVGDERRALLDQIAGSSLQMEQAVYEQLKDAFIHAHEKSFVLVSTDGETVDLAIDTTDYKFYEKGGSPRSASEDQKLLTKLRIELESQGRQIVGRYHTHPTFVGEAAKEEGIEGIRIETQFLSLDEERPAAHNDPSMDDLEFFVHEWKQPEEALMLIASVVEGEGFRIKGILPLGIMDYFPQERKGEARCLFNVRSGEVLSSRGKCSENFYRKMVSKLKPVLTRFRRTETHVPNRAAGIRDAYSIHTFSAFLDVPVELKK